MNNICSINQKWVREPSPDPLDLRAAMKAKVPILKVDNVTDFSDALKELKDRDINVNTYTLNSHGTGGNSITKSQ